MAVLVDLENLEIRASIRDLVSQGQQGPGGLGLLGRARADLGQRVHQQYRAEAEQTSADFEAEVSVALERQVDGFAAVLRGRVDGLFRRPEGWIVEEVKSVVIGGAELARARPEFFPDFSLQLRLYALALAEANPAIHIEARLVLVSLLDRSRRVLDLEPHPKGTRQRLDDLLREAIGRARADRERRAHLSKLAARLRFPFDRPRPRQDDLVGAIEEGFASNRPVLAMAPTGIGKTVAALVAALRQGLGSDRQILFLTAKTTQQRLVEETFSQVCQASEFAPGDLRCLTLRAKEKMCPPGHLLCHPKVCGLLEDFQGRLGRSGAMEQLITDTSLISPDAVLASGEAHALCPYQLSMAALPAADLIVADYNYAYDPGVSLQQLFTGEQRLPPLLIVDEAHNLFDRARGYYSPFISRPELERLDLDFLAGTYLADSDRSEQLAFRELLTTVDGPALFSALAALTRDAMAIIDRAARASEERGGDSLDDCRPLEMELAPFADLGDRAEALLVPYVLYNRTHSLVRPRDPVVNLLARLVRLRDVLAIDSPAFIAYGAGSRAPGGRGAGCLCVNPAEQLSATHRRSGGTLAMSATLTPLDYYADVLGFAGLDPVKITLPSPFPKENLGVWAVPAIDTSFRMRDQSYADVARVIGQTVSAHQGRYVAFFPSFKYLASVQAELRLPGTKVLVQLPGMSDSARARLLDRFRGGAGSCLLLGVMGGVFAEGVDLPGAELIGAVVVGPGLPQVGFERAAMQHYFQEQYQAGFAYAMLFPGLQRVIQSAGRVIRTSSDQGVIVLVGRRFGDPQVLGCLPEHWYGYRPDELLTDDLASALKGFWRQAAVGD